MSAAAVLRSAACRALCWRPSSSSLARTLVADKQRFLQLPPMLREMITPRRLYSCGVNMKELPERHLDPHGKLGNSGPANLVVPEEFQRRLLQKQVQGQHAFLTLDEVSNILDRRRLLLQHLLQEKIKYERLKRFLVRGPIFVGLAIYVKQRFFDESAEDKEMTAGSD